MDIEKESRSELITSLGDGFTRFEEVTLRHATFSRKLVRADVVAVPHDPRLSGYALAFEVKVSKGRGIGKWCETLRQASDYVYARIEPRVPAQAYAGRRIAAAFVFPGPIYTAPSVLRPEHAPDPMTFEMDREAVSGALLLALQFRVGYARREIRRSRTRFQLYFGPNDIWNDKEGFVPRGLPLLLNGRRIGSQRLDPKAELDGYGADLEKNGPSFPI